MGTLFPIVMTQSPEDGVIPSARILLSTNPSDTNTLTIGNAVYEFVDPAVNSSVAVDSRVAVVIGANAAATQVNLLAAINNTVATPHPTLFLTDGVTPAVSRGNTNVVGTDSGDYLVIQPANAPGGTALASSPSIALSDTLAAVVAWSMTNLNLGGGRTRTLSTTARTQFTVTTAMIAAASHTFDVGFTVAGFLVAYRTSTGAHKAPGADTLAVSTGAFTLTLAGGGGDLANGDVVSVYAWS